MRIPARTVVAVTVTLFAVLLAHAVMTLATIQAELRAEITESRIWSTAQAEREAHKFLLALADQARDPSINNVSHHFELLYSRIALLTEGPQYRYFQSIGAGPIVDEALALLDRLDAMLLRGMSRAEIDTQFHPLLNELEVTLGKLSNVTWLRDRAERVERRAKQADATQLMLIAIIGVLLTGLTMAGLLLRSMRGLISTSAELERHRASLEDTVALRTRELRESLEVERRAKEIYASFIVTVSHQFRTPVSIIHMIAQRQLRDPQAELSDTLRRKFTRILEATVRLDKVLAGFLTSAGTEAEGAPLAQRRIELNTLAAAALEKLAQDFPNRRVTQSFEQGPLTLIGDPVLLIQAILGVLTNAVQYSEPDSVVHISTSRKDDFILCAVHDQGVGIPESARKSIFERFYRAPEVHHLPGAGLGLTFARAIVLQHGGVIDFTSEQTVGSIFTISLPAAGEHEE